MLVPTYCGQQSDSRRKLWFSIPRNRDSFSLRPDEAVKFAGIKLAIGQLLIKSPKLIPGARNDRKKNNRRVRPKIPRSKQGNCKKLQPAGP